MGTHEQLVLDGVKALGGLLVFLFTSPLGLGICGATGLVMVSLRIGVALRSAALTARAAGERLEIPGILLTLADTLLGMAGRLLVSLPTLILVAAMAMTVAALGTTLSRIDESAAAARRIQELSTVLKNLQRSLKVADVRVLSVDQGRTSLSIDFYDPSVPSAPVSHRDLEIQGRDIYFDAIVLNFDYSQIAGGQKINIAIPYRVFSDQVAQRDGLPLGAMDSQGIPLVFHRGDDDIYGLAPEVYRSRLKELVDLIRNDEVARKAGIVRSLYGSAIHRPVKAGDRLEIRIEQTGGLTVRDAFPF